MATELTFEKFYLMLFSMILRAKSANPPRQQKFSKFHFPLNVPYAMAVELAFEKFYPMLLLMTLRANTPRLL